MSGNPFLVSCEAGEQMLSFGEVEDMLVHLLRCPEFYAEARARLGLEHFAAADAAGYRLLLNVAYGLGDDLYRGKPLPYRAVYNGCWNALSTAVPPLDPVQQDA